MSQPPSDPFQPAQNDPSTPSTTSWTQPLGQPGTTAPGPEVAFGPPPAARRSKRGVIAGGVAAVVLIGGAGAGFAAYQKLAQHGAQPDTVLPASAVAYARLDLDPSAGQKISATRFLSKLPSSVKSGDTVDLKKSLWGWIAKSDPKLAQIDYANDVEPWLGNRAGVAVLPGGTADEPNTVIAVETTDTSKAKAGIDKIAQADGSSDYDITLKDDYALITPKDKAGALATELTKGTLATNSTYVDDVKSLGDTGVMSVWVDSKGVGDLLTSSGRSLPGVDLDQLGASGRVAMALRFDADYVELAGVAHGGTFSASQAKPASGGAASLPADTMVAVQLSGLGEQVTKQWSTISKSIPADVLTQIESEYDVTLPDDLATLLGSNLTLSAPKQDLTAVGETLPTIGAKIETTDPAKADGIVTKVASSLNVDDLVQHEVSGSTLYLSTTPEYLASLKQTGTLGASAGFTKAVADPSGSVLYADLTQLSPIYSADVPSDYKDLVSSLTAVGFSATASGTGDSSFALRVVGQ